MNAAIRQICLFKSLLLPRSHLGTVQHCFLATCVQKKGTSILPILAISGRNLQVTVSCIGVASGVENQNHENGARFQQQRTYAKMPPRQKKFLKFDYSGDLTTQNPLNPEDTLQHFRSIAELKDVPESVQRLCSIDFASGTEKKEHRLKEMRERIWHLFGKDADRELHVAMLTVEIRNLIPHLLSAKKDKYNKSILVEKIQLRKKILKQLRRTDYQRFLWLLQELRIQYVLPPAYYRHISRKVKQKQEVWEAANNLRLKKIAVLREQLEAEKADFLKFKEETLKQIEEDAKRYDLDMASFEKKLIRERIGKTYPRIYTWEERVQMEKDAAMK